MGDKNFTNVPLVDRKNIVFPSIHIKLGLFKQFFKALYKEGNRFKYIKAPFPSVWEEKTKAEGFDGPYIRKLIMDPKFILFMNNVEANAWKTFVSVVINFLSNRNQDNYSVMVENLIKRFH